MPERATLGAVNIDRSASRLTDTILGDDEQELIETLRAIAREIGLRHVAHIRFELDKVSVSLPTAIATFSRAWQTRYFLQGYVHIDPVVSHGRNAVFPFDWDTLARDGPTVLEFLADAARHDVGRNGVSIPVRNRTGRRSLVSFTSDHPKKEWVQFKLASMVGLQKLSSLIDSAADVHAKLPLPAVTLSRPEEECLIWAARGKTAEEIGDAMNVGYRTVKAHLDTVRHKLHCMNLTQAIAVAIATGVIPGKSLRSA
jgi:DNA-binding CsgD family transcriptional regulator